MTFVHDEQSCNKKLLANTNFEPETTDEEKKITWAYTRSYSQRMKIGISFWI